MTGPRPTFLGHTLPLRRTFDEAIPATIRKKLNAGDYNGAADEFLRWDKAGGKTLPGLTRRRKSERNLFLGISPAIVR